MKNPDVLVTCPIGWRLDDFCRAAVSVAGATGYSIRAEFNRAILIVRPSTSPAALIRTWYRKTSPQRGEVRRNNAAKRQWSRLMKARAA